MTSDVQIAQKSASVTNKFVDNDNAAFCIGMDILTHSKLAHLSAQPFPSLDFVPAVREVVYKFRSIAEDKLISPSTHYGINTGFGFLADVKIDADKLDALQENLVRSHAVGVGEFLEDRFVRAMLILRAHTFALGHSGVRVEVVDKILELLSHDVLPVVPCQGSVGASGDLAPLAHIALALIGEGRVRYKGDVRPTKDVFSILGILPLKLKAKEGLSLTNGTHFMAALGAIAVHEAKALVESATVISALSLEAVRGTPVAFDARIHQLKPHKGQLDVAKRLWSLLREAGPDPIQNSHENCGKVQDPYSFRCVPQVHGAALDAIRYVAGVVDVELNSISDNPLVFEDGSILSGGNFHGEHIAIAMDILAIAMAELGSISEQRTMKLTNPNMSGLPGFLVKNSGLNSGFMMAHVTAAALVSENKGLCHPASVDSIPTSADKEDHVSMGPYAVRKALRVAMNVARILSIESLAACQGIDLLDGLRPNLKLEKFYNGVRSLSATMVDDRYFAEEIEDLALTISKGEFLKWEN